MTYRERREARAERLRLWADGREAKADAAFSTAQQIGDSIPMGQPILVGHHSEAKHRKAIERIDANMRHGVEHSRKAEEMRERAENIERAAERAIYSDDPDAADSLRAKIARLEEERERITAYNKSCRERGKADPTTQVGDTSLLSDKQRADLLSIAKHCPYQLRQFGQFPSYATSNIGGTINAARKRLAGLER